MQVGNALYWYDAKKKILVWKSEVVDVDRFEYASKKELRQRLKKGFVGFDPVKSDPYLSYFKKAPDQGYCLTFKVKPVHRLNIPRPNTLRFPGNGWLSCDNQEALEWLGGGASEPSEQTTLEDERAKKLREIAQRQGQPEFRSRLLAEYRRRCAITGCDAEAALEAAHIMPYLGPESNQVANGLLLRADIHTLFDLYLIGVDPESLKVVIAEPLRGTCYTKLEGRKLTLPRDPANYPASDYLKQRWMKFTGEPTT